MGLQWSIRSRYSPGSNNNLVNQIQNEDVVFCQIVVLVVHKSSRKDILQVLQKRSALSIIILVQLEEKNETN